MVLNAAASASTWSNLEKRACGSECSTASQLQSLAIFDLPNKQKVGMTKNRVRESEIGEECQQFLGVKFAIKIR